MSLSDPIVLSVDVLADANFADQTFGRYIGNGENYSVYNGENHSSALRNTLGFYRTFPKPQGNYRGVERSAVKTTQDVVITGADGLSQLTKPAIIETKFNRPVGLSDSDWLAIKQRHLAAIGNKILMDSLTNALVV